jgi:outer membrane phospholipase A
MAGARLRLSVSLVLALLGGSALRDVRAEEHAMATAEAGKTEVETGDVTVVPAGRSRYWQRIAAYEPSYFLVEPLPPSLRPGNTKIQLSFAFQLIGNPKFTIVEGDERADGLYGAFSQTSFWNTGVESKPFYDSSYRPEIFWHQGLLPGLFGSDGLAGEAGLGHESNGRAEEDSRSYNLLYVRPQIRWDFNHGWWSRLSPKIFTYIGSMSENPDMKRYRGYGDLDIAIGNREGILLALRGRVGSKLDRGSLQADLSYPSDRITGGWTHGYLYAQTFVGWSENLLNYDQKVEQPRILIGFAITR